jgi:pimeloyl-ACP methyl ester carboxylesterase
LKTSLAIALLFSCLIVASATAQTPTPLPAPIPGSFIDVENGKIYYEECGAGLQAVVLLHDGLTHSAIFDSVWPAFCKSFHAIRYDRRGHGRSPESTTWYTETEDLATLLRHLKVSKTVLVGSSHGGELSIDFTLQYPQMAQQLVLVGSVVSGMPYSDHFLNRGMENSKPFEKNDKAAGVANWANDKYVLGTGHEEARKKLLQLLTANPQDLTHNDYARPTQTALPRLHEIKIPTLIVTGDADIPDVHAHAGAIEAGIRGSRRIVLNNAGHLPYLELPDEFTKVVIGFIQANDVSLKNDVAR